MASMQRRRKLAELQGGSWTTLSLLLCVCADKRGFDFNHIGVRRPKSISFDANLTRGFDI